MTCIFLLLNELSSYVLTFTVITSKYGALSGHDYQLLTQNWAEKEGRQAGVSSQHLSQQFSKLMEIRSWIFFFFWTVLLERLLNLIYPVALWKLVTRIGSISLANWLTVHSPSTDSSSRPFHPFGAEMKIFPLRSLSLSLHPKELRGRGPRLKVQITVGILSLNVLFRSARVDGASMWSFCGEGAFIIHLWQGKRLVPCQRERTQYSVLWLSKASNHPSLKPLFALSLVWPRTGARRLPS